jgi:hypothetical protein
MKFEIAQGPICKTASSPPSFGSMARKTGGPVRPNHRRPGSREARPGREIKRGEGDELDGLLTSGGDGRELPESGGAAPAAGWPPAWPGGGAGGAGRWRAAT